MKYCNNCLIPETAETNQYDENGVCSVCNQIKQKNKIDWKKRQIELDQIIVLFHFLEVKTPLLPCGICQVKKVFVYWLYVLIIIF